MTITTFGPTGRDLDSYLALVRELPLVAIASGPHYDAAVAMVDRLTRIPEEEADAGAEAYLAALSELIVAYDNVHFPIGPPTDAAILQGLLDAQGVTAAELARRTGIPRSSVSEVLAGKKAFTRTIVERLSGTFGIPAARLTVNYGSAASDVAEETAGAQADSTDDRP